MRNLSPVRFAWPALMIWPAPSFTAGLAPPSFLSQTCCAVLRTLFVNLSKSTEEEMDVSTENRDCGSPFYAQKIGKNNYKKEIVQTNILTARRGPRVRSSRSWGEEISRRGANSSGTDRLSVNKTVVPSISSACSWRNSRSWRPWKSWVPTWGGFIISMEAYWETTRRTGSTRYAAVSDQPNGGCPSWIEYDLSDRRL